MLINSSSHYKRPHYNFPGGGGGGGGAWQLAAGHWIPAKMPMTIVHPRPDSEITGVARQQYAYADGVFQYRIPISVQGGAWPFHYELILGPAGASIAQADFNPADPYNSNYGAVIWTPTSEGGPYTFQAKVTDQDGSTATVTWTATALNSQFIFIDPAAVTNGTGTKASPFNTMVGLSVAVAGGVASAYYGKMFTYRAGTTTFTGAETNGNLHLKSNYNAYIFLGYTGETCTLNFSASAIINDDQSDLYIGQIGITNARTDGVNIGGQINTAFIFSTQVTAENRVTLFEMPASNAAYSTNTPHDSNEGVIVFDNPGTIRNYFSYTYSTLTNCSVPYYDIYMVKYGVHEGCQTVGNPALFPYGGFFVKSDAQYFTIRNNYSVHGSGYGVIVIYGQSQTVTNNNIEVGYNTIINLSADLNDGALMGFNNGSIGLNTTPNLYIFRNTLVGGYGAYGDYAWNLIEDKNIVIDDYGMSAKYNISNPVNGCTVTETNTLAGSSSTGILDVNYKLTGTYRTSYLGTRGAEIG